MAGRNASHMAMARRSSATGTAVLCFLVVVSLLLAPSLFVAGTEAVAAYGTYNACYGAASVLMI